MAIATDVTVPQKELVVMSLQKILVVVFAVIALSAAAEECQAQNSFKRHRPLRWLGQGFSDGYQRCNPGHDTSYYNPYSAHNSHLVSQSPEYLASASRYAPSLGHGGPARYFTGVPFSVYAAPAQSTFNSVLSPAEQVESSFAPSVSPKPKAVDSGNEFEGSRMSPTEAGQGDSSDEDEAQPRAGEEEMEFDKDEDISDLDELSLLPLFGN